MLLLFIGGSLKVENNQIVGISKGCGQNSDMVSKNDTSCHICIMKLKGVVVKHEKYGILSMNDPTAVNNVNINSPRN